MTFRLDIEVSLNWQNFGINGRQPTSFNFVNNHAPFARSGKISLMYIVNKKSAGFFKQDLNNSIIPFSLW